MREKKGRPFGWPFLIERGAGSFTSDAIYAIIAGSFRSFLSGMCTRQISRNEHGFGRHAEFFETPNV